MSLSHSFAKMAVLTGAALLLGLTLPAGANQEKQAEQPAAPVIEVVFCLDTTGSMAKLIDGAKAKIWSLSNQIVGGKPAPELKIGLVAYRDRGDEYITKIFDLTDDLDAVYANLREFKAAGGGDFPESVNQALHEAVTKIKWSDNPNALKIIFLVGDAPPKMGYPDDVKYPETCQLACKKGIIINSIQCGNNNETAKYWKDICVKAEGSYVQIAQDGGVQTVATPFDKRLAEINTELAKSTIVYGDDRARGEGMNKLRAAEALPAPAAADRAAFAGKSGGVAVYDLLDSIKNGKVKLEEVKKEHLPPEMQKMTVDEMKAHLQKTEARRNDLRKEAVDLDRQRADFITKQLAERGRDGFDNQVLEILRRQAEKHKIKY